MQGLQKYRIGIVALAALTLVLLVYVVAQSSSYKEDQETNELATGIAEDLNKYIRDNDELPDSLDEVTSKVIPSSIKYTDNNDGTYTFCTTYNSSSNGSSLNANDILYQGLSGGYAESDSSFQSSYKPSALYISNYSWVSGENCIDVEPYIYTAPAIRQNSNYLDVYCDPEHVYYEFYEDSCVDGKYKY